MLFVHNLLRDIAKDSNNFFIQKHDFMLNDFFFVFINFGFLLFLEFWWLLSANNDDSLIKVVEDVFEIISFELTIVSFLEYSFAVAKNACNHLKSDTAVH